MPDLVTKSPTLVAELFGASVGFRFHRRWRRVCGALLIGTALLLGVRRLAGAFDRPPMFGTALTVMIAATAIAAWYRVLRRREAAAEPWAGFDTTMPFHLQRLLIFENAAVWYLPTVALAIIAASLSLPGAGSAALGAIWLTFVAGEAGWFGTTLKPDHTSASAAKRNTPAAPPPDAGRTAAAHVEPAGAAADVVMAPVFETDDSENVSQSWTRYRDDDGSEVIEGFVRVTFVAGSRQAAIHLSFCPPLDRSPTIEAEPVDEAICDELDLKLTPAIVLPYAARLDARLADPAEEELQLKIAIRAVAQAGESDSESGSGKL